MLREGMAFIHDLAVFWKYNPVFIHLLAYDSLLFLLLFVYIIS